MLPALLSSVAIPVILDLFKSAAPAVTRKWFGVSVDDQIKINNADVERLKALAVLDTPGGTPSQWVIDLRASFRYIAAIVLILVGGSVAYVGIDQQDAEIVATGIDLASSPFGFIFGERLVLSYKAGAK